ncbi:acyl-CoA N-acyltransferase [Aaosphaeria arxii CBS 175.79]|uniref:Acyl-CoA N-acyltransferase n=1 Tax=Aaosphaeria arxii CBS 175.79 TaxID=1450172 RepID=A0A6A5Y0D2_9PLEO|nr:acyl-CoA N-acyltransferase [Aaosphaeria arxii CBS 175.79]KAF2018643.1 acyl-CoA N-acyltransferase [Aaosphaeria arxii CBS 175.79]
MSNPTPISIRPADPADLPHLPVIESASDQIFGATDMHSIADSSPPSIESYTQAQSLGHIWVATPTNSTSTTGVSAPPVAFITIALHYNCEALKSAFIHQISVLPEYARQGIGGRLIEFVAVWAGENGFKALELTTFEHVPWNKKYYERLGFKVLVGEEYDGEDAREVRERLEEERKDELLGKWSRVAMRKML